MLSDRVAHYYFNLPTNGGAFSATATLVWKKFAGPLDNLELFLFDADSNTLVTCSTSSVDNVEHIFAPKLPAGRYDLQVLKRGGAGQMGAESYALAFDFASVKLSVVRSPQMWWWHGQRHPQALCSNRLPRLMRRSSGRTSRSIPFSVTR